MRIVDATSRLIRAPEVRFAAAEIGLEAFGHNIENRHLVAALEARAQTLPALAADRGRRPRGRDQPSRASRSSLKGGDRVTARLVVGADGRRSLCRAAAGIESDGRVYPQTALTFNLAHTRPHQDTSTEFHTETGPFTLVPLPGDRSSLVCVVEPADAERIAALDDAALDDEIERRSHSILGKIAVEPGRGVFPLAVETARSFGRSRIALIGEAAHLIPPIGAQGLNLGLRDAATIGELVVAARRDGGDVGAAEVLARYDALRRADVQEPDVRGRSAQPLAACPISCRCRARAASASTCSTASRPLRRAVLREGVAPAAVAAPPDARRGAVRHSCRTQVSFIAVAGFAFVFAGFVKGVLGQGLPTVAVGLLSLDHVARRGRRAGGHPGAVDQHLAGLVRALRCMPLIRRLWPTLWQAFSAPSSRPGSASAC